MADADVCGDLVIPDAIPKLLQALRQDTTLDTYSGRMHQRSAVGRRSGIQNGGLKATKTCSP